MNSIITPNVMLTLRIGCIFDMVGKFPHEFFGYIGCSYDTSATPQDPRGQFLWNLPPNARISQKKITYLPTLRKFTHLPPKRSRMEFTYSRL